MRHFVFLAATLPIAFAASLTALPASASAGTCSIDIDALDASLAALEQSYGDVLSDIGCDAPVLPAHQLMCDAAETPDADLWRMGRLADMAWVYAYENATGQEQDHAKPPPNDGYIAARDACADTACLCAVLVSATNDSLGGLSPYPQ